MAVDTRLLPLCSLILLFARSTVADDLTLEKEEKENADVQVEGEQVGTTIYVDLRNYYSSGFYSSSYVLCAKFNNCREF